MTASTLARPAPPAPTPARPGRRPQWTTVALGGLLLGTALLYLWGLSASGYGNEFYAAAVQAGTKSWKALFFGSLDSSNSITVDKPPASLWVMALSGRIFGFSSWSLLAPQALEGVAAVGLLYAAVKRWYGPVAGLLAGAILALTPVAVLMFRFNNPDALLVLLLVAAAYAMVRAVERAGTRWLLLAGALVGFGFLTKMLQALLVLPAFALMYLVAAPTTRWRRVWQLLAAGGAMVAAAGWWVLAVALWPASSRPYIGGSTNNSVLELAFGYNGLGRLFGGTGNGGGGTGGGGNAGGLGGGQNTSFGGTAGLFRMFGSSFGTEISWLLPAALVALVAGGFLTWRARRTDRARAGLLLWGGWLVVTALVFSFMKGTIHPYYAVALAPGIAATVAIGGVLLWRARQDIVARVLLAVLVLTTAFWDYVLLARTSTWHPELRYAVLVIGLLAATGVLLGAHLGRRIARPVAIATVAAVLLGSTAYGLSTATVAHNGSIPTSGPTASAMGGGVGGGGTTTTNSQLVALLTASSTRWAAATVGAQSAAGLELSSGTAVMAIGGFTGSDPSPTLAGFQALVAKGDIHYFIVGGGGGAGGGGAGGGFGGGGGRGGNSTISTWVAAHYTATTVGGQTVYDLTRAASA